MRQMKRTFDQKISDRAGAIIAYYRKPFIDVI